MSLGTQGAVHADLRNSHYVQWTAFLRKTEGWSADRIAEYQLSKVRRVVRMAWEGAPGYRRLYEEHGVGPETVRTLDDLRRLPIMEKETIRDAVEEFCVPMDDVEYVTTGGSTGIPFGFYRDRVAFARELASKAHQYYRVGWKEADAQMVLRGLPIDTRDHTKLHADFNELRCSSYHLVPECAEVFRRRAWEYRPDWLRCYPSSGHLFARLIREGGKPFPPLKGILCASENLYDFQKGLMTEVFGARVFSHYGQYELAVLAGFCEYEDTYHVLPQYGYAELLDGNGDAVNEPGATGEIVGTSFIMRATPFIRYRTRDYAVLDSWECEACRRPYQVWRRIEGRLQEFIVTGGGRLISMTAINMHDDIFDAIRQFQFHQHARGRVTFRYVARSNADPDLDDIRRRLLLKLGDDVELTMEPVEEIRPTLRGKHRFLLQELDLGVGDA